MELPVIMTILVFIYTEINFINSQEWECSHLLFQILLSEKFGSIDADEIGHVQGGMAHKPEQLIQTGWRQFL